jgi:hypothetical protein
MGTTTPTKPSAPVEVDEYMKALRHPLADVVQALSTDHPQGGS